MGTKRYRGRDAEKRDVLNEVTVAKIKDITGFHGSLKLLQEQDAEFAKATGAFDRTVADLRHFLDHGALPAQADAQGLADRALKPAKSFSKALGTLSTLVKAIPTTAKRVAGIKVQAPEPNRDELMAKAVNALMFDASLNAAQRGSLMLAASAAQGFAKSEQHPVAAQVEAIRTSLEKAKAERDIAGPAAVYLEEALAHISHGITDADDRGRLMSLLQQLKMALGAGDEGAL